MSVFPLLFNMLLLLVVILTISASTRLALAGFIQFPKNKLLNIFMWKGWCYSLFLFMPWMVGAFARAETSPLPWRAFIISQAKHGNLDSSLIMAGIVLIVDLWLLWIPANIWINSHSDESLLTKNMARIINLLAGILLLTKDNFFYQLINLFSSGD